jgi:vesicular inhibitory amino acid transporter
MFGDGIKDAITSNILKSGGYPKALTILMCICVAIIPLTKIPLNARPLITTADVLAGIHPSIHHHHHTNAPATRRTQLITFLTRFAIRLFVVAVLLGISIAFPAFDSVCAFLGAALCTLISIILPISFYLKLFWRDVTAREKMVLFSLLGLFSVFGTVGTIWTFLPKPLIGLA